MLLQFLETGKVLYIMLAFSILGVLSKFLVNGRYRKLIKQSENMGTAKDKYLKQWKVKFENTYRSSSGVNNIPVYVERNMGQYKFMGVRLNRLERLNRLAAAFLCLGGMVASFMTYWYAGVTKTVVLYVFSGFALGGAMILWETLCNTPGKYSQLLLCIRDYFENTLVKRLESGQPAELSPAMEGAGASGGPGGVMEAAVSGDASFSENPGVLDGQAADLLRKSEEAAGREQDAAFLKKRLERIASGRHGGGHARKLTDEEEHLIEDIIQEYLYE
ncbi:hypothetical protein [Qiania dongpingensis]|uniref:Uncharacterized protein n=1 Tax=Qiania dongpingensis TaxID=2763669 RepID=A0A7G9G190_9FIRM|nr:hypothetical protein [Qiania dongpingensis]QNM04572.1 hypothetical protein H9Q78_08800 [Qiania dongpingensis]